MKKEKELNESTTIRKLRIVRNIKLEIVVNVDYNCSIN